MKPKGKIAHGEAYVQSLSNKREAEGDGSLATSVLESLTALQQAKAVKQEAAARSPPSRRREPSTTPATGAELTPVSASIARMHAMREAEAGSDVELDGEAEKRNKEASDAGVFMKSAEPELADFGEADRQGNERWGIYQVFARSQVLVCVCVCE